MSSKFPAQNDRSRGSSSLWASHNKPRNSLFVGAQPGQGFGSNLGKTSSTKTKKPNSGSSRKRNKRDRSGKGLFSGFWSGDKKGSNHGHLNDVDSRGLPLVIKVASRYVERCLSTEGLYRVSGNKTSVQQFYDTFRKGEGAAISFAHSDVHVWTGLLKQFLRDQPEPLLTFELFDSFIEIAGVQQKDMRSHFLQTIMSNIPAENLPCIAHLMLHLHTVASKKEQNFMGYDNLGVVFGPTVLRPREETMEYVKKVADGNKVVSMMIELAPKLFADYNKSEMKRRERVKKAS